MFTMTIRSKIKLFLVSIAVFSAILRRNVEGKRWRVATPYPGTYETVKDPLHNLPEDGQSKMQRHMARMKDVFDFRRDGNRKTQDNNYLVQKAKQNIDNSKKEDASKTTFSFRRKQPETVEPIMKDRRSKVPPQPARRPRFPFPGALRK